jgi:hypothetical protein
MKLHLLYTPNAPTDRELDYLQRQLTERHIPSEVLDADSRSGIAFAELYDVMARPAVVVTTDDGGLMQKWEGRLPSLDEVSYYVKAA